MSPELLDPEQFGLDHSRPTKESDCYALGMVIYEVLTGKSPFASLKNHIVARKVTDGKRPGRPEGVKGSGLRISCGRRWTCVGRCMHRNGRASRLYASVWNGFQALGSRSAHKWKRLTRTIGTSQFLRYGPLFLSALLHAPGSFPLLIIPPILHQK